MARRLRRDDLPADHPAAGVRVSIIRQSDIGACTRHRLGVAFPGGALEFQFSVPGHSQAIRVLFTGASGIRLDSEAI